MRGRFLDILCHLALKRRRWVLASAVLTTVILGGAAERLEIDVRWSTLLPQSLPVVQEYTKIDENFLQPGNLIVVISGPDAEVLEQITDEATAILEREMVCEAAWPEARCKETERYARYVYGKLPEEWLTKHAMALAKPKDARRLSRVLADPRLLPYLVHLNDDLESEYTDSENVKNQEREIVGSLEAVHGFVQALESSAGGEAVRGRAPRTARDLTIGRPYMMSLDNGMSLIMVASSISTMDAHTIPLVDKRVEALLKPLEEKYPDYSIQRTGMTAVAREEMDSIGPQTMWITFGALIALFIVLAWNFRSVLTPVIALSPIIVGVIWSVGVIALTLGQMNLITVMIMVVLLGLGIDFSIHIASRFEEELTAGLCVEAALRKALGETGVGVITGALTTAVAFFALMVAETKGIFEFGLCAGIGVLVTLLAVLWLMPTLLAWRAERLSSKNKIVRRDYAFRSLERVAHGMGRWRWGVIVACTAMVVAGAMAAARLEWEWNFNNLEPAGIPAVTLQDEIIERYKLSISMGLVTAPSVEASRTLRKRFKSKGLVGDVDDVSLWVSRPDFEENLPHMEALRAAARLERGALRLAGESPGSGGEELAALSSQERRALFADEVDRLWANLVEIQALSFTGGQDRVVEKTQQLVATRESRDQGRLRRLADRLADGKDVDWAAIDAFGSAFRVAMAERVADMTSSAAPVTFDMVPVAHRERYTSKTSDGFLVQIMPKRNLYEKEDLELFQEMAASIDPHVTGIPQMMLMMNLETLREGGMAVLAAVIAILIILLIDFRRPLVAVLAFVPVIAGTAFTLGVMWLLGEKLNYINVIAFPVIIGIGVDDGVHFFHRYLQEGKGGAARTLRSVGHAMMMTSATTMIGFGSLMFYLMQGMASMGLVLFVGVGGCLLFTLTALPALARVFEGRLLKS